ncbi:ABC transporter related protein [Candidatus Vecturithrix granuli]|uniref:ABC transporter related protein n=1 Tax=Vecturithrix granuli TaxID=1499967 RepID=A0A081BUP3_VECG1|nr:ABC transporter related protein [Candidatus Vecturithrix granuli]
MPNPLIEIQHLSKRYGSIWALRDITLNVEAGTRLTLLGPNGSGKTTLIRILARLSSPSSGSLKMFGSDLHTQGDEVRKQIGVVSHTSFLYPALTAVENLTFYAGMFGVSQTTETIESLLYEVGLLERQHDLVRTFSRGMQQRLAIARAILHQPTLLLFDEPYSGLDGAAVNLLQHILTNIHHEGRTIILTTHNYRSGLDFCDQAAVLVSGRLVYYGSPAHIRIAAKNPDFPETPGDVHP